MKRLFALLAGALGLRALLRRRSREHASEEQRAEVLRAKLAESRTVESDRADFESGEKPVDEADVATKRADVHARARQAIDDLSN
jgi:hypothetical protein